ncbi:MAG: uracil-xanthine permease [Oscillospiraceae bacterium]|nr:uracil-xanthine permease [Oscillospiraceae bacterium]
MAKNKKSAIPETGITDARQLGIPRMLILGFQHMFAMFGATVLVPLLTGLDVATTLLMAGLGTLLFHVITGMKVPAFLGSSFAFLGGYAAVAPMLEEGTVPNKEMLPYACLGVACAGLVYLILAGLIKLVGINKVMRFFPPVVTGPIIIAIGLGLSGSAVGNCSANWPLALIALAIVIVFNIWGKGMSKIVPILLGVVGSYVVALIVGNGFGVEGWAVDFTAVQQAKWIGLPIHGSETIFAIDWKNTSLILSSIIAIVPIALATMMEHIGDISAIGATVGKNYIKDPGLHRTLIGDGLATTLSSIFGGPANTTYGENTGVLALSKVYDPRVIRLAAIFAVIVSFSPKFAAVINSMPTAIIGGISFVLYGMISAIGVRNVVESKVDFTKSRNLIIAAVILVSALGLGNAATFNISENFTISLSALAVASIAGILLNAILPGKDYTFSEDEPKDTGVNFAAGQNTKRQEKEVKDAE